MDIFSFFTLAGGLALFLYGMMVMSSGLEKVAGGRMEKLLRKMTANPIKSLALGAGITAVIQSSSAVTVMLVGLVNSGIMELSQTIGVMMGSNIGTTVTAWILSLSGIESTNFFVRMLKPESFSPIVVFIGVIMIMSSKTVKKKNIGSILTGFAILMFGMEFMKASMNPLADMPQFTHILTAFSNPILGVVAGALVTAVIQSSSASVGILQALSMTGSITSTIAIPIIIGQNLGTFASALISSIGVNKNARRVAVIHVLLYVIGAIVFLPIFQIGNMIFHFGFLKKTVNPFDIAIMHSIFNIFTTVLLFPFIKQLEQLSNVIVKDTDKKEKTVLLDERLLLTPSFAISECTALTLKMASLVEHNLINSTKMLKSYHGKKAEQIEANEAKIDKYEDKLGTFLLKLAGKELTEEDSSKISQLLLTIGDYERIGDHCQHILKVSQKMSEDGQKFTTDATEELKVIVEAVSDIFLMTLEVFENDNTVLAKEIEPLEQVIKKIIRKVKSRHIERVQKGLCNSSINFIFIDLLSDFRRIAAHCSNIAICTIQRKELSMEKHKYSHKNKKSDNLEYKGRYANYKSKYYVNQDEPEELITN